MYELAGQVRRLARELDAAAATLEREEDRKEASCIFRDLWRASEKLAAMAGTDLLTEATDGTSFSVEPQTVIEKKAQFDELADSALGLYRELDRVAGQLALEEDGRIEQIGTDLIWAVENLSVIGRHQIGEALNDMFGRRTSQGSRRTK